MELKNTYTRAFFEKAGKVKHLFPESTCVVPISVGQDYHEGEKFKATMRLVNQHFKECVIMVCDSLQRHTLKMKHHLTEQEAYKLSIKNGDEWIQRNRSAIAALTIPHEMMRWDKWLQHSEFDKYHAILISAYEHDHDLRQAFVQTIDHFAQRYQRSTTKIISHKDILFSSLRYIVEECVVEILWGAYGYEFELYPVRQSKAMDIVKSKYPCSRNFQNRLIPCFLKTHEKLTMTEACYE